MDTLKKRIFGYHFSTSLVIITLISVICQFLWFPQPFLQLDGTWLALLMLASVDIIIGPLLTLFLVNNKKSRRELSLDMSIIVIIQILALTYGLMQIEKERVVALVHYDGVFHLVPKKVLSESLNNKKNIPTLNLYQNIPLVMISELDAIKYNQQHTKKSLPFLYAIENYQPLIAEKIATHTFKYKNLPEDIAKKYGQDYIFKVLAGKQRTAIIVFNQEMSIADLQLLPKVER